MTILGIERRRIYDIVNILESFEMIKRIQKNIYTLAPPIRIKDKIEALEVYYYINNQSFSINLELNPTKRPLNFLHPSTTLKMN